MGTQWMINMAGIKLTEDQLQQIPYPRMELATHVTTKTIESGVILGGAVAAPVALLFRPQSRNSAGLQEHMLRYGKRGALIGLIVGPIMAFGRMHSLSDEGVYDRCFQLRHNENQLRVDRAAYLGAGAGAVYCLINAMPASAGALLGLSGGLLLATTYNLLH